jgi:hypothetical protein
MSINTQLLQPVLNFLWTQNLDSLLTNNKHSSGFSDNVQDIIKQFKFRNKIETLDEDEILFSLI